MNAAVFPRPPSTAQRLRLTACLALIALPHLAHLPFWVSALAWALIAWQALAAWFDRPPPGRLIRIALTAAAFVAVFAGFGRINGQNAGVSLLLLLLALKLCEIRSHRDAIVFLSLTAFLLITQFLFSQSLAMMALLVAGTWLIVAALIDVSTHARTRAALGIGLRLMLQALPIAALMFVLFPRIPGPIWGLPADAGATAATGLSEQMSPGSIARLALSAGVALRARFDGGPPARDQRYWRGPVLWDFDGRTWSRHIADARMPAARPTLAGGHRRTAEITLEPSHHDWLIALDVPTNAHRRSHLTAGATLTTDNDIDQRIQYRATSIVGGVLDPTLSPRVRRRALLLPVAGNPQSRALAERWRQQGLAPMAIIRRALTRFRTQTYVYTLTPPPISGPNSVDRFLFDTRKGFCEHYAGAFTVLMRAAGVPARVVTGYQGGERGLVGDYWVVRNADAHAWSEVWIDGRGWVRVDPTAAVAPGRIESGVAASVSGNSDLPYMARAGGQTWYRAQMLWDAVDAGWNRWFLAYGPSLQQRLLAGLGLGGLRAALIALTLGVVALLGVVSLGLGWRMRTPRAADPVMRAWQRIGRRLTRLGYPRRPHEGPIAYGERVAAERPELGAELRALVALYARLRYGRQPSDHDRLRFIRAARAFPPRRRPRRPRSGTT